MDQIDFLRRLLEETTDFNMVWTFERKNYGWSWSYQSISSKELFDSKADCIYDFVRNVLTALDNETNNRTNTDEDE